MEILDWARPPHPPFRVFPKNSLFLLLPLLHKLGLLCCKIWWSSYDDMTIIIWGYNDADMLPVSYHYRKYMVCMVLIVIYWRKVEMSRRREKQKTREDRASQPMECQKTEFRNFVDTFCYKINDELGDQFNESLIIVTNIVIRFVRIFVKWIKEKKNHEIWGKNWWNNWWWS